jgi:hypothetical protein
VRETIRALALWRFLAVMGEIAAIASMGSIVAVTTATSSS